MKKRFGLGLLSSAVAALCMCGLTGCAWRTDPPEHVWGDEYTLAAAYDKAVELGYTRTLDEFIAAISGKDGVDGKDGADGKDGTDGKDGADGKDGVGIGSVEIDADGDLAVTDTDGNVIFKSKLPSCRHEYSDVTTGLLPTCTSAGYGYRVCALCGDKDYEIAPALGHEWDGGVTAVAAGCSSGGWKLYTCDECGATRTELLSATGVHDFKNGSCALCGLGYNEYIDGYYNGDYNYEYLSSLPNGEALCGLYDDIKTQVIEFHDDRTADAAASNDGYALPSIDYSRYGITLDQAVSVWTAFLNDKPLYYWVSKSLVATYESITLGVEPEYALGAERTEKNKRLYAAIDDFTVAEKSVGAYSAAFAYHDKIIRAADYAYTASGSAESEAWAHNITGVFDGKGAVCEGYARAFQLLLNVSGVENIFVTGRSRNEGHAWNLVKLDDGKWYWYDLTWDDTPELYWGVSRTYFCVTDEAFLKNHTVNGSELSGADFQCALPERAQAEYDGEEIVIGNVFTSSGCEYTVVGYDTAVLSAVKRAGDLYVPQTVTNGGTEYAVVGLTPFYDGKPNVNGSVFDGEYPVASVVIHAEIAYISDGALYGSALKRITVAEANPVYRSIDGVLFSASGKTLMCYPAAATRTEYRIPDATEYITRHAFGGVGNSEKLQKLVIGKNLKRVGIAAWGLADPDKSMNVVTGGWNRLLNQLSGARSVEIDADNPAFAIRDDMLFDKTETYLYAGLPNITVAIIPDTVYGIDTDAFEDCEKLTKVRFPRGLTEIPRLFLGCAALTDVELPEGAVEIDGDCFGSCYALEEIVIPSSVAVIGKGAFRWCSALTSLVMPKSVREVKEHWLDYAYNANIYYAGTEQEWNAIDMDRSFMSAERYKGKVYFYSEDIPEAAGNHWHYVDGKPAAW